MCRHLAYLGPPVTLRSMIIDPPFGLYRQAWAPRLQRHGTMNADGFGVGWYAPGDQDPARYRHAGPIWGDESFADVARMTPAGAMLAAVRSATAGTDHGAAAIAPFASGQWLFSHNGVVHGWPDSVAGLAATLPMKSLLRLEARVDSALLWALVLDRLRSGRGPADALADTVGALRSAGVTGRFNFLLTDGEVIAATAVGDTLYWRRWPGAAVNAARPGGAVVAGPGGVIVASEPGDDEPSWTEVPDGSVVTATPGQVSMTELAALTTDAHVTDAHVTDAHTTDAHVTDAHVTDAHVTDAHVTDAHTTDAHTTDGRTAIR